MSGATSMLHDHGPGSEDGISTRNNPPSGHDGTAIAINRHVYQSLTNDAFKTRVKIFHICCLVTENHVVFSVWDV